LHTGDVGEWVDETYVKITDRMKDVSSRGRQERRTVGDRELAQGLAVYQRAIVNRRQAAVSRVVGIELDTVGHGRRVVIATHISRLGRKKEVRALVHPSWADVNARSHGRLSPIRWLFDIREALSEFLDHDGASSLPPR